MRGLLVIAITLPAAPMYAQDCPASIPKADENCPIIVTGSLPLAMSDLKIPSNVIEGKILSPKMPLRVENLLAAVPGLQQFRRSDARSANPTSQGLTMRGLGGNASSRVAVFLDDVPQADPFGGWIALPGYDAINFARIAVIKGAGRPSAGPGAVAGVIEIDSLQNTGEASLALSYGSRDSIEARARFIEKLGQGSISVSGSYARGNGFIPIISGQRGIADRAAPYEQAALTLRGVIPINEDIELQANMRGFTDERDRGFDFSDSQNSGVDASMRIVNRGDGWRWSALGYVQLREFANRFGAVAPDRNSVAITLDQYAVPSTGMGVRFEVRPPLSDATELRIGGDWRRTIGKTKENFFFSGAVAGRSRIAGGQSETVGGFVEGSYRPNDAVILTLGGRADHWRIANGFRKETNVSGLLAGTTRSDDVFADRSGWRGTGRAGFSVETIDSLKLIGSAYLGWRLPTLNELYRPFRVGADTTAANELLTLERIKGAEIGLEYYSPYLRFIATGFVNRLNGAIANVAQGQGPGNFPGVGFVAAGGTYRQRQNLGAIDSKGVEVYGTYTVDDFVMRAGYSYVDAKVVSSGNALALNGRRPAQVPQHFANAGVTYDGPRINLEADLRYIGGQFEDDGNIRALNSALTVNLGAQFVFFDEFLVQVYGENIFDTEVQAAISNIEIIERATPRTIWLGLKVKFQ